MWSATITGRSRKIFLLTQPMQFLFWGEGLVYLKLTLASINLDVFITSGKL